jgi:tellurite resistance protein
MPYRTAKEDLDADPEVWRAASAAFSIIATADGLLANIEQTRFEGWLSQRSTNPALQREALSHCLKTCQQLLGADADVALQEARALVRACASPAHRDMVLSAGRAALVADGSIDEREELALRHLCEWLEIDPNLG